MTATFLGRTRVGSTFLPELPPDWPVAFDYETAGLYPDGDSGTKTQPASPEGRASALAIAWFDPETGELVSHAFPFDQGKIAGKPGRAIRDPETGRQSFSPIQATLDFDNPNLEPQWYVELMAWLSRRRYLVAHNAKFDMAVARIGLRADAGGFGGEEGLGGTELDQEGTYIYDTMLSQMLLAPLDMPSLKPTAKKLWGDDETEELEALKKGLKANGVGLGKRYDLVDWPILAKYAAKDAELTIRLHQVQMNAVDDEIAPPLYESLLEDDLQTMRVLYRMEKRGLPFLKEDGLEVAEELRKHAKMVASTMPFDPSKLAQAIRFFYGWKCSNSEIRSQKFLTGDERDWSKFLCDKSCEECQGKNGLGLEPTSRTEKRGDPQLNQAEIDKLAKQGQPWIKEFQEYVSCMSAIAKWYDGWSLRVGKDGRLRPVFKQGKQETDKSGGAKSKEGGTKTGRLAVERVQIQAVPRKTHLPIPAPHPKKLIRPTSGKVVWESDLPNGEMRIVTVMSNCNAMWDIIDKLDREKDASGIHGLVCTQMFGLTPEDEDFPTFKQVSKCIGFGTVFQSGPQTLADQVYQQCGVKFKVQEMKDFIADFRGKFPEIQQLSDLAVKKADQWRGLGYVTLINGRNRWFEPHERVATCAMSSVIQGSLAETMKTSMRQVEATYPGILINQVHDSVWVEVDDSPEGEALAWDVARMVQNTFEETFDVRERPRMKFPVTPERLDLK
jgi:hypothetical protein